MNAALSQMKAEFNKQYRTTSRELISRVETIYKSSHADEVTVSEELIEHTRDKLSEQERVFEQFGSTPLTEEFLRLLNK